MNMQDERSRLRGMTDAGDLQARMHNGDGKEARAGIGLGRCLPSRQDTRDGVAISLSCLYCLHVDGQPALDASCTGGNLGSRARGGELMAAG